MRVISDAEQLAETAVPQLRAARWAVYLVAAVVVLALVGFLYWWMLVRPRAAQVQAATARAEAATSAGTANVATGTLGITLDVNQRHAAIDLVTQGNDNAIRSAQGASDSVGADLDRAGRTALCLRAAYQHQPDCAALHGYRGGVGPAQGDGGSAAAGQ